ncbi:major facilitator superfamily protein [Xanthomonas fragariae]|nr:major facilitator superfamily protein [Xanthomonas fragariae]
MTATGSQSLSQLRPALRAFSARQVRPARLAGHEKPTLPGSASTPLHPTRRRIQYGLVGGVVALTGGLSNALVTANLTYLQGTLGAYATEMAWLPAAYVMTNMSANLLLVKFRQ